jgi:hypothetical protein
MGAAGAMSYHTETGRFDAGIGRAITPSGTRLRLAVGYGQTNLRDSLGGGGRLDVTDVWLYAAQPDGDLT